jgi:hypothetical protein
MSMDRRRTAVAPPANDPVERSRLEIATENRVLVTDLVGEARIAGHGPPALTGGTEAALRHQEILPR